MIVWLIMGVCALGIVLMISDVLGKNWDYETKKFVGGCLAVACLGTLLFGSLTTEKITYTVPKQVSVAKTKTQVIVEADDHVARWDDAKHYLGIDENTKFVMKHSWNYFGIRLYSSIEVAK